jgi:hypothetical protein
LLRKVLDFPAVIKPGIVFERWAKLGKKVIENV